MITSIASVFISTFSPVTKDAYRFTKTNDPVIIPPLNFFNFTNYNRNTHKRDTDFSRFDHPSIFGVLFIILIILNYHMDLPDKCNKFFA